MLGLLTTVVVGVWLLRRAWLQPATSVAMTFGVLAMDAFNRSSFPWLAEWKVAQGLTVLVVTIACVRQVSRYGVRSALLHRSVFLRAALVYFAYALLAASWSSDPGASALVWLSFSKYLVVFILGAHLVVRDRADLGVALREIALVWTPYLALVLFAGRWGARGVISMLASDHEWEGFGAGEVGYLVLPTLAAACALTLPLLTRWPRWLRTVGVVIMLALIVRSGARGQLVACALGAAAYVPSWALRALGVALLRGAVMVAIAFGIAVLLDQGEYPQVLLRWTAARLQAALQERWDLISQLWVAYADGGWGTILFGLGTAESGVLMGIYPHFIPVEVLCEQGIVGLALLGTALGVLITQARRVIRTTGRSDTDAAIIALFLFLCLVGLKSGGVLASPWLWTTAALLGRGVLPAVDGRLGAERGATNS
ncbi:O-antigen ligase family protein [Planctomycetota bacterium]|nr:O-antigen ligase family protein [Planctomycetota bacterium]